MSWPVKSPFYLNNCTFKHIIYLYTWRVHLVVFLFIHFVSNIPFARWHHFNSTPRIHHRVAFLYKLGSCYLNLSGQTKFKHERKYEMNSSLSSKQRHHILGVSS